MNAGQSKFLPPSERAKGTGHYSWSGQWDPTEINLLEGQ